MRYFPFLSCALWLLLAGCGGEKGGGGAEGIFIPVDTNFNADVLLVPKGGYEFRVLFREGDAVWAPNGSLAAAKGSHDFLAFLPVEGRPGHGRLWVNHEAAVADPVLGDGGGATLVEVYRDSVAGWRAVGKPTAVDFGPVGGTIANCLGAVTPWGTVLTSEEVEPKNNRSFFADPARPVLRDTSRVLLPDSNGRSIPRWMNCGWMVEADPIEGKALRKLYAMGRMMHEGNYCMPDQQTVYMMDDNGPGAFFKFVADAPGDLRAGQLFAFTLADSNGRSAWIPLPRAIDSLVYARDMAFKRGASIFLRMEDIDRGEDGRFYITETGKDSVDLSRAIALGGKPAPWLEGLAYGDGAYDDPYGRILVFDPAKDALSVLLEGGQAAKKGDVHFSNPDNIALDHKRNLLVVHEDINGLDKGRNPVGSREATNEIYVLDLGIDKPSLDDLMRLAVVPKGAESTGGVWNSDYSAFFFNVQDPSPDNPPPFDRSATVVLTGWPD